MRVCKWCVCVRVYVRVSSWVELHVAAFRTRLVRSGPTARDLDPIRIGVLCGPDRLAIKKLTHGMIRKFVPVRAVEIRR